MGDGGDCVLQWSWLTALASVLVMAAGLCAAGASAAEAAPGKGVATDAAPGKSPAAKADPFAVPDGSPDELLKYLESVGDLEPPAGDRETLLQFSKKAARSILTATDKILAAKPSENQAIEAVQWRIGALEMLVRSGDPQARARLDGLPGELEKAGWAKLARGARGMMLGSALEAFDGDDPKAFEPLIEQVKAYVSQGELGRAEIGLMMQAAFTAERLGTELAVRTYEDFAKLLSASQNKEIAAVGATMQGAARRLTLVGKPMALAGVTLGGEKLDWAKYRGKVVLVTFWATWCGPCREEIKSIRKNYAAYRDKGFEVVAISIDKYRTQLEEYLKQAAFPWTVVFDQSLRSEQADQTMATAYGVMQIPQLILVGKDGNVLALDVRGARLKKLLRGLLGEPDQPAESQPAQTPS